MRLLLVITLITLSFQSWTKANDIRDFEVEGMSIGDSALKFFTQKQIIKNSRADHYSNNKYTPVQNDFLDFFKLYDAVDFNFKTNDKDFTIVSLSGVIIYDDDNIENCYPKMREIIRDLEIEFSNLDQTEIEEAIHPSPKNKSRKSILINKRKSVWKNGS